MDRFSQGYYVQLNGKGGPEDSPKPGDSSTGVPLIQGTNPAWNPLVQLIPEDKRAEAVSVLKEWDSSYNKLQENYAPWKDFNNSGVKPDQAQVAIDFLAATENNPKMVYDRLGDYLGVSKETAKEMVENVTASGNSSENSSEEIVDITKHPDYQKMKQQLDTMGQIILKRHEEERAVAAEKEQEALLDKELNDLKQKHGDFPEDEVVMRMLHLDLTAEKALEHYQEHLKSVSKKTGAPMLLSGGGRVPRQDLDVKKMDDKATKDLVVQFLEQSSPGG